MQLKAIQRVCSLLVGGFALTLLTVGCGDDPVIDSSNRGAGSHTEATTVENAYIVPTFLPGRCAVQLALGAHLRFTVTNNRSTDTERLLGVSSDAANGASITGNVDVPPSSTVGFGQPSADAVDSGGRVPAVHLNGLDPDLRPAMSAQVTFRFVRAGDITMPVPIEACPVQAP